MVSYHRTRRSRSALAYGPRSTTATQTTSTGSYTTNGDATMSGPGSTGTGFGGSGGRSCERSWSSGGVCLLVFDRRDVAEALVQAGGVVPADVLDDGELELCAASPDAVCDQLGLEAVDKRLGERVDAPMSSWVLLRW